MPREGVGSKWSGRVTSIFSASMACMISTRSIRSVDDGSGFVAGGDLAMTSSEKSSLSVCSSISSSKSST